MGLVSANKTLFEKLEGKKVNKKLLIFMKVHTKKDLL